MKCKYCGKQMNEIIDAFGNNIFKKEDMEERRINGYPFPARYKLLKVKYLAEGEIISYCESRHEYFELKKKKDIKEGDSINKEYLERLKWYRGIE